jgi:hypothetical protein
MGRKFINIKPIDEQGERPDRPADEVQWVDLSNAWFDKGLMKKRPAASDAAHTAVAATCTANSPCHTIVQFRHPVAIDADNTERPNGAGNNTDWTVTGAASNYLAVDDVVVTDSDYVSSANTTNRDSYAFSNTSLTVIDKLVFRIRAERSRENDYVLTIFARTGAAAELDVGTVTVTAATGDSAVFEDFYLDSTTDPHTSAAWTAANFNNYEFGFYVSTLDADTFTETLAPSSTGTHSEFIITSTQSDATYQDLYAYNNQFTPPANTEQAYSKTDDAKMSLEFTEGRAFTTITNAYLEIYGLDIYGERKLEVYVDKAGTESLYGTRKYTAAPRKPEPGWLLTLSTYDDVQVPNMESTLGVYVDDNGADIDTDTGFSTDPANSDAAWSPSTIYTYDWVIKATSTWSGPQFADIMTSFGVQPNSLGSSVNYNVGGTTGVNNYTNSSTEMYDGTSYTGGASYNGNEVAQTVQDYIVGTHPKPNWSFGTPSYSLYSPTFYTGGTNVTDEDDVYGVTYLAIAVDSSFLGTGGSSSDVAYQDAYIGAYGLGQNGWSFTRGLGRAIRWKVRSFDDSSNSTYYIGEDGWTVADHVTGVNFFTTYLGGELGRVSFSRASPNYTTTYRMFFYGMKCVARYYMYPYMRIHGVKLKLTGTAVAKPKVSLFSVTVEGATGTDRRESKILVTSTDIQRYDDTATLTDVIGGVTNPSAEGTVRFDTCKFFGKQYFTNGVNYIYRYPDATNTCDELTTVSICETLSAFIGRLFLGATTESGTYFPDRVRWSIIEDDSDWTGTGSGYIDLNDTDGEIVKILPLGGMLVAYKNSSIYNLYPTGDRDDAIVKQVQSPAIGCLAPGTVKAVVNREGLPAHIFLGQGLGGVNVYMYTTNILQPIGDDIKEELRDNMSAHQRKNAFAAVDYKRNQYMFFVAYEGETFPKQAWTYDIDTGQWKSWELANAITCAGVWETTEADSTIDEWTLLLGEETSLVKWLDSAAYQDHDGTNVTLTAISGDYSMSERAKYGTIYRLHVYYYDHGYTPITVYTSTDGGDTYSSGTTKYIGSTDADGSLNHAAVDLMATGRRFRVKIEHDANAKVAFTEFQMEIEEQGWIY